MEDIRTLCNNCKYDYWQAGYKTKSVGAKYRELCDKCSYRMGWTYILIQPEEGDKPWTIKVRKGSIRLTR